MLKYVSLLLATIAIAAIFFFGFGHLYESVPVTSCMQEANSSRCLPDREDKLEPYRSRGVLVGGAVGGVAVLMFAAGWSKDKTKKAK